MPCRSRNNFLLRHRAALLAAATLATATLFAASCAPRAEEGVVIAPNPQPQGSRLGPEVVPLSSGPGDKGSPRVGPSGSRVAFVLDGAPAEKPLRTGTQSFLPGPPLAPSGKGPEAVGLEWLGDGGLAVLEPVAGTHGHYALHVAEDGQESPVKVAEAVEDAAAVPGSTAAIAAIPTVEDSAGKEGETWRLALFSGVGPPELYPNELPGHATGLSVAPDGKRALLAVERRGAHEVWSLRLSNGAARRLARLPEGLEILSSPQWAASPSGEDAADTRGGTAYFVAGEGGNGANADKAPYSLYQTAAGGGAGGPDAEIEPKPVESVGEGFAAASVRVSPDGRLLAVLGRRSPNAPPELYVLDPATGTLTAATENEGMEIKTGPRDLAWTPDGSAVVLVARGTLSGPETYDGPAASLRPAFFNLYEVPVEREPAEKAGYEVRAVAGGTP